MIKNTYFCFRDLFLAYFILSAVDVILRYRALHTCTQPAIV